MDAAQLVELLKKHPTRSRWEYVNFVLEPYGEFTGRAILSQLHRLNEINALLAQDTDSSQTIDLTHEQQQIEAWLSTFSQTEMQQHLSDIEGTEAAYWTQRLGREAAVDLLSKGRVSPEVMSRAILLDETNYMEFTKTCTTIGKVINDITMQVEREMGVFNPNNLPQGEPQ